MRFTILDLTEHQKQALLDLLVLGMYADHKLALAEDEFLQQLLDTFAFSSEYDRQTFADAAFTRARRHAQSLEAIRRYVEELAESFPTLETRRNAYEALDEMLMADGIMTEEKAQMLSAVRRAFALDSLKSGSSYT